MTAGIGHNSGRSDEPGRAWRQHVWRKARVDLMPKLPIEIMRRRVARAKELGLPYKTYAGLRAASGDDLIGFMFSSNAMGVVRAADKIPPARVHKITELTARTIAMAQGSVPPAALVPPAQHAYVEPRPHAPWGEVGKTTASALGAARMPSGRTVLICATTLEEEWAQAARMAGVLPAEQFLQPHDTCC